MIMASAYNKPNAVCLFLFILCLFGNISSIEAMAQEKADDLNVSVLMRDGKSLMADVFRPSPENRYPTLFIFTPYNRRYGGAPLPDELLATDLLDRTHYAYVIVDQRGRFGSKSAAEGVKEINNGNDGFDAVEWIAKQRWSNGKIGMWGTSAVGSVIYEVAAKKPAHLVCAVPASATYGLSYKQFYYGGVLKKHYLSVFTAALSPQAGRLIERNDEYNDFWRKAEAKASLREIDLPMLFVTGWYDTSIDLKIDTFKKFRDIAKKHGKDMKLILGPWLHTAIGKKRQGAMEYPAAEGYADNQAMRFFDYWLRDKKENGWQKEPPVRYFQMGLDEWRASSDWPPSHENVSYYLRAGGRLSEEKPASEKPDAYVYDPKDPTPTVGGNVVEVRNDRLRIPAGPQDLSKEVEGRGDVVLYSTDVLKKDINVAGNVVAKLYVTSNRKDTDFAVRLSDVYPDGRAILVTDGIQRMSFRRSLENRELVEPGRIYECTVILEPTAQTFLKGHRMRISVSSSNYPKYDVNLNLDRKRLIAPHGVDATNSIYHESAYSSVLILPVW